VHTFFKGNQCIYIFMFDIFNVHVTRSNMYNMLLPYDVVRHESNEKKSSEH
jgi:hypothetical protein